VPLGCGKDDEGHFSAAVGRRQVRGYPITKRLQENHFREGLIHVRVPNGKIAFRKEVFESESRGRSFSRKKVKVAFSHPEEWVSEDCALPVKEEVLTITDLLKGQREKKNIDQKEKKHYVMGREKKLGGERIKAFIVGTARKTGAMGLGEEHH